MDNPTTRFRLYLEGRGLWDETQEKTLRAALRKEVLHKVQVAYCLNFIEFMFE